MKFLKRQEKPDLAYVHTKGESDLPPVMFLGGFRSDMEGTKAIFLENFCQKRNQEFIRFDYSGHGKSEGKFEEWGISDWAEDALSILEHCIDRPAILIGSSMGGWIAFLLALKQSKKVHTVIGLAAAPDFTVWMEEKMSDDQKYALSNEGQFELPNDYDDTPYIITKRLIDDGRQNILLNGTQKISAPIYLIQGKQDADVPWETAERIKENLGNNKTQITYIDDADHRLSAPEQLEILRQVLSAV